MKPHLLVARRLFPDLLEPLVAHYALRLHDHDEALSPAALQAQMQGCWGLLGSGSERVDAALLAACPDLRAIALITVGYNNLDVAACRQHGLLLSHAPGVLTEATAEFGLTLLLATARRVGESERFLRAGQWRGWGIDQFAGLPVMGRTLGIVGLGRIGQEVARTAQQGLRMQVLHHSRRPVAGWESGWRSLPDLLAQSDHVMLCVPYSPDTHHLIGAAQLAQMKPSATLINLARGGVVDDRALAQALIRGQIAAAGLDVFEGEPTVCTDLLACDNAVLTPHIASSTLPTRRAMVQCAVDNLLAWARGEPGPTPIPQ
ncbi:2-hydroxyacid dehydrogenase [Inhella gelatinilytica]|uniref:D-glycerate dehydrogenase n=1 Tax=Inhella gelatinilytica TaxID=2795030 RepID=A0A931J2B1_9BURK|nr:D-glycerate dehydrogenase [Inhella gelatinilytica]MBH9554183.1 D-glycerate dehydrogenase [Inhella gelatinilytica]